MLLLGLAIGFFMGGGFGIRIAVWACRDQIERATRQRDEMIDAMDRIEAHALEVESGVALPTEVEKKLDRLKELEAGPSKTAQDKVELQKQLRRMSSYNRCEIEIARLEKGMEPMDPLDGLSDYFKAEIMQARIEHGWG